MNANSSQIFNVFSQDEIQKIIDLCNKLPKIKHPLYDNIYCNGFTESDLIYYVFKKIVFDKINAVSDTKIKKLLVGMQLVSRNPFGVHSDYAGKNDQGFGTAFLVPLYQLPFPGNTIIENSKTIIFDQCFTETQHMDDYIKTNPPLPKSNAEDIWEKHFDHDPIEYAKYLSVKVIGEWEIGSVILWDRPLLHTSDNFLKKNIMEKSALVIFTTSV